MVKCLRCVAINVIFTRFKMVLFLFWVLALIGTPSGRCWDDELRVFLH